MTKYFQGLCKYRWLLNQLVSRDLKVKYKRSVLGYVWSLLNPLLMTIVLTAVFSNVFRFNVENYPIYFLSGNILFTFFAESTSMAMTSIIAGAGLIKKVYVPKYILPLSRVMSSFVNLLFSLVALFIMMIITQTPIYWTFLLFPIPLLFVFFLSLGMGLIISVMATCFRDMLHLYNVFTTALMYLTPIFYPVEIVPPQIYSFIKLNPLYHMIDYFRRVVMWGQVPSLYENLVCVGFCVLFLGVGLFVFKKNQDKFFLYI
jgi:ABC-2 type transport system permease protein